MAPNREFGLEERFTTSEAGRRLGVSTRTIQRWLEEGLFPGAYRLNPTNPRSHVRIPAADVRRVERQREPRPDPA